MLCVSAVNKRLGVLTKGKAFPVEIQDTVLILIFFSDINSLIIGVHVEPGLNCREACILGIIPLYRGSGRITAGQMYSVKAPLRILLEVIGVIVGN